MIRPIFVVIAGGFLAVTQMTAAAQPFTPPAGLFPNLASNIERPLRYQPEGGDFVIENGAEFFNRPLYGGNTAFRVDAGDQPEFTLYLPGRGGNLRLGMRTENGVRWLFEAETVVTRYRPGEMLYEIRDPLLGPDAALHLAVLALHETDGLIVRAELVRKGASRDDRGALELVWAFGGANGQRGRRDGDIGTEAVPIGEYFQLQPAFCRDNAFAIESNTFVLHSARATIAGTMPAGAVNAVADASAWGTCGALLDSMGRTDIAAPVVAGYVGIAAGTPLFLALQRVPDGAPVDSEELSTYREVTAPRSGAKDARSAAPLPPRFPLDMLPEVFARAEAHFAALRSQVAIETPDPFIDAAVAALNVGADAVWDEPQGVVMHGAIAWRSRLLGWRGPYAMDALGWHDRARSHLAYWATRQNTDPIPDVLPPPDEKSNLARSEAALHSNGDMSNSHYDMNLVYIDALFRHILWTGDLELAGELWPVIERHLAWERRMFRREFGPEELPLYEAYAAIWASDDLEYHGGGVAYTSAYNLYHNRMAARLACVLGRDASPYEREAGLIARGMRELLWGPERGAFAEFKDLLGRQLVHPEAGLWSVYHVIDSGVPSPTEALAMTHHVDREIPHLPVRGPGVPADRDYHVLSSTTWMPYTWSVNNVVMGENIHTALAFWQAGRPEEAFTLTKGALLASMFMGICPGNVGSMDYLDVYRRESQRDFADGAGVTSRAIVEGLFGLRPDALAGELRIEPGFPASWDHASIRRPGVGLAFRREGAQDEYTIQTDFPWLKRTVLRLPAGQAADADVRVGGQSAKVPFSEDELGRRWLEIPVEGRGHANVVVKWTRGLPGASASEHVAEKMPGDPSEEWFDFRPGGLDAQWTCVDLRSHFNDRVSQIFRHEYRSPRSPFVSLAMPKQGIGAWAGHVNAMAEIDDSGLRAAAGAHDGRLVLPGDVPLATPGPGVESNILFTSMWDNFPDEATVPLSGRGRRIVLLMAGSTNWMQSRIDNGEVVVTYADGGTARLPLHNPTTWWPIEQDYFVDDFQFRRPGSLPTRVDLKTGKVRALDERTFVGAGGPVDGGAATVLVLPLDSERELRSLTVRSLANEVVIGLMAATIERP